MREKHAAASSSAAAQAAASASPGLFEASILTVAISMEDVNLRRVRVEFRNGTDRECKVTGYLFELHTQLEVLMPREAVDGLLKMACTTRPIKAEVLTRYLERMAAAEGDMDANEKKLLKRIAMYRDAMKIRV